MADTPMTAARRAALMSAQALIRGGRASEMRADPSFLAEFTRLAPARKPAWGDATGRALCSLRDWLLAGFPEPLPATAREVEAALAEGGRVVDERTAADVDALLRAVDALTVLETREDGGVVVGPRGWEMLREARAALG